MLDVFKLKNEKELKVARMRHICISRDWNLVTGKDMGKESWTIINSIK